MYKFRHYTIPRCGKICSQGENMQDTANTILTPPPQTFEIFSFTCHHIHLSLALALDGGQVLVPVSDSSGAGPKHYKILFQDCQ